MLNIMCYWMRDTHYELRGSGTGKSGPRPKIYWSVLESVCAVVMAWLLIRCVYAAAAYTLRIRCVYAAYEPALGCPKMRWYSRLGPVPNLRIFFTFPGFAIARRGVPGSPASG